MDTPPKSDSYESSFTAGHLYPKTKKSPAKKGSSPSSSVVRQPMSILDVESPAPQRVRSKTRTGKSRPRAGQPKVRAGRSKPKAGQSNPRAGPSQPRTRGRRVVQPPPLSSVSSASLPPHLNTRRVAGCAADGAAGTWHSHEGPKAVAPLETPTNKRRGNSLSGVMDISRAFGIRRTISYFSESDGETNVGNHQWGGGLYARSPASSRVESIAGFQQQQEWAATVQRERKHPCGTLIRAPARHNIYEAVEIQKREGRKSGNVTDDQERIESVVTGASEMEKDGTNSIIENPLFGEPAAVSARKDRAK